MLGLPQRCRPPDFITGREEEPCRRHHGGDRGYHAALERLTCGNRLDILLVDLLVVHNRGASESSRDRVLHVPRRLLPPHILATRNEATRFRNRHHSYFFRNRSGTLSRDLHLHSWYHEHFPMRSRPCTEYRRDGTLSNNHGSDTCVGVVLNEVSHPNTLRRIGPPTFSATHVAIATPGAIASLAIALIKAVLPQVSQLLGVDHRYRLWQPGTLRRALADCGGPLSEDIVASPRRLSIARISIASIPCLQASKAASLLRAIVVARVVVTGLRHGNFAGAATETHTGPRLL
mmetsp:Transcript_115959/g.247822  ORF Transcript_115959/g.247822 Transcript_115959/m.247822 type:complete len:290 (+) Transcript_115959:532-1401(+)